MVVESKKNIVLLSIKPKYAHAILAGGKTVEFRKIQFKREVSHVMIYSSSPEMKVVGYFEIDRVDVGRPMTAWKKYRLQGGISYQDYSNYYEGRDTAVAIAIKCVTVLSKPVTLNGLKRGLKAPQSFCYLDSLYLKKLMNWDGTVLGAG